MTNDKFATYKKLKGIPVHKIYHKNSELNTLNYCNFGSTIFNALSDFDFKEKLDNCDEKYTNYPLISLSEKSVEPKINDIFEVLKERRSIRSFTTDPVNIDTFSTLLRNSFYCNGVYEKTDTKPRVNLLPYPVAGAIQAVDVFIAVTNVDGLKNGLYYYEPLKHCLRLVKDGFKVEEYKTLTVSYSLAVQSSFTVYLAANINLKGYKYGDRAYRFATLEAGHMAQNLYLTGTALDIGIVASGGFMDGEIYELIKLLNEDYFVLYELFGGNPDYTVDCRFERE